MCCDEECDRSEPSGVTAETISSTATKFTTATASSTSVAATSASTTTTSSSTTTAAVSALYDNTALFCDESGTRGSLIAIFSLSVVVCILLLVIALLLIKLRRFDAKPVKKEFKNDQHQNHQQQEQQQNGEAPSFVAESTFGDNVNPLYNRRSANLELPSVDEHIYQEIKF